MKKLKGLLEASLVLMMFSSASCGFAATLIVNNNNDSGAGSLRQAVLDNNLLGGSNLITFAGVNGTIPLSSGELLVTNPVSIIGPGDKLLALQGNYSARIFRVTNATVSISGLTICNGSNFLGGGILQQGGTLSLAGCTVVNNKAINGGGIAQTNGTLLLSDCTISSNSVAGTGMGIYAQSNVVTRLQRCTLAGNTGTGFTSSGGGISHNGSSLILDTCTFCANGSPGGNGGGLLNTTGNTSVTNCTFYGNRSFVGGAVSVLSGSVLIRNSILASNTSIISGAGAAPDCSGPVISAGFNLVGNGTNSSGWGGTGDQVGTGSSPINPVLGPLQANGGPTWTMALLNGSPAIDKGHSSGALTDQRGALRPRDKGSVANAPGSDAGDIGAYETGATTLTVSNLNTEGPGSLYKAILDADPEDITTINFAPNVIGIIWPPGELLLDKNLVINGPGASLLALAGSYRSRVFSVKYGASIVISGLTIQDGQLIGGDPEDAEEGENVEGGAILNRENLSMFDCVITNNIAKGGKGGTLLGGAAPPGGYARGGAIANLGTLALTRCVLSGNSAVGGNGGSASGGGSDGEAGNAWGGALYNEATANLTNCTFHGNSLAPGFSTVGTSFGMGGGIYNYSVLNMVNCTIALNNLAPSGETLGGGIYDDGNSSLVRSTTIAGNFAGGGGGVYCNGNMTFGNTIIAGNSALSGPDARGLILSSDYNLVQDLSGVIINGPTAHSLLGQDPMLDFLGNYGGPVPTIPMLNGSPVIDRGFSFGLATDQRGEMRPFDFSEVPNASGGDGSDIGAYELQGVFRPRLNIVRAGNDVLLFWPTNPVPFRLESASNLLPSASWSTVPGTPALSGANFIVTNALSGKRFYRLSNP